MSRPLYTSRSLWGAGIGLGLVVAVAICVLIYTPPRSTDTSPSVLESSSNASNTVPNSAPPIISKPAVTVIEPPRILPHLEFAPGSVEEACGLNEFPPFHYDDPENKLDWLAALKDATCWSALADHINAIDPYLFLWGKKLYHKRTTAFVVLDEPITFERIFTDPVGDFARVQEALSNPECVLTGDETNWELAETCHADAFLNYALINRFCFDERITARTGTIYWPEDNPTPKQDRLMWKQRLEAQWVEEKCEEQDPVLELTEHPELYDLLISLHDPKSKYVRLELTEEILIELAARLGDDAAGLTQFMPGFTGSGPSYSEEGYKYGRFSGLLTSSEWRAFERKEPPTIDRFVQTFHLLAMVSARRPNPRDEIKFDWEWVARHLCEPPYYRHFSEPVPEEPPEHSSCGEIVHELRQRNLKYAPLLQALDKFERVAVELEVFE